MNLAQRMARFMVKIYQWLLAPALGLLAPGFASGCRFRPSCSDYALEAIGGHGALKGSWLAFKRILRCHPWGGEGYDPPPAPTRSACGCPHHHPTH